MRRSMSSRPERLNRQYGFDQESGLQFTQTTMDIQEKDDQDWEYERNPDRQFGWNVKGADGVMTIPSKNLPRHGARSLQITLHEYIVKNIRQVCCDGISCLPTHLAQSIWDTLCERRLVSLHNFKIFSEVLGRSDPKQDLLRYRAQKDSPKSPLDTFTIPLTSKSFKFLVILSITERVDTAQLVKLMSLANLVALEIVVPSRDVDTGVSDRLIRTWSQAAQNEGAFPVLTILRLWNHKDLTNQSLPFLEMFPALTIYDVRGCGLIPGIMSLIGHYNYWLGSHVDIMTLVDSECAKWLKGSQAKRGFQLEMTGCISHKSLSDKKDLKPIPMDKTLLDVYISTTSKNNVTPVVSMNRGQSQFERWLHQISDKLWDFSLVSTVSRIRNLKSRNDASAKGDAHREYLNVNRSIGLRPTVSLRLGPTWPCLMFDATSLPFGLIFTRKNFASCVKTASASLEGCLNDPQLASQHDAQSVNSAEERIKNSLDSKMKQVIPPSYCDSKSPAVKMSTHKSMIYHSQTQSYPGTRKRKSSSVMKNKKRKLDDILNSFM